jgi:WD40 repeat protein
VFDTRSGRVLWGIPQSNVPALDFSADGSAAAALEWGQRSATVALLDGATGRRLREFVVPEQPLQQPKALRLTPDGRRAAVTFFSRTALSLWDTETGRPMPVPDGHVTSVYKLAAAPDWRWAVSCAGRELRCWDLTDGRLRWQTEGEFSLSGVAIPPGGQTVLACRMDGQVDEREAATGRTIRTVAAGIPDLSVIRSFTIAADGQSAYIRRHYHMSDSIDLDVIDLRPGAGPARRIALSQFGRVIVLTPDGRRVGVGPPDKDQPAALCDVTTGRRRVLLPGVAGVLPRAVSADGRLVIAAQATRYQEPGITPGHWATEHGQLRFIEALTGQEVADIHSPVDGYGGKYEVLRLAPDGRTLAVAYQNHALAVLDIATGRERLRLAGSGVAVTELQFTPDGGRLLGGHDDGTTLVWDVAAATRRPVAAAATPQQLDGWWADLAGDAARAHAAVWALAAVPDQAVPLLAERVKPDTGVPADRIAALIADLDSPRFAVREAARKALAELGDAAEPALRAALAKNPSPEQRRSIQTLLDAPPGSLPPEAGRQSRAVQAAELAGTPEAVRLLERWVAAGPSPLARDAREALDRLRP